METVRNNFILVNKLGESANDAENGAAANHHLKWNNSELAHMALLHSILSVIFMSGDVIREEALMKFLVKTGLQDQDAAGSTDGFFGSNVKQMIEKDWGAKQHYIDIKKVSLKKNANVVVQTVDLLEF